jgi:hypothetical protein
VEEIGAEAEEEGVVMVWWWREGRKKVKDEGEGD